MRAENVGTVIVLAICYAGTIWCWRRIWLADDLRFFKIALTIVAAVPFVGPFLYFFVDMPPRRRVVAQRARKHESEVLRHWNEREHVYLAWASAIFAALAVLAYWMNDWKPGNIHADPILWALYTDVDVIFFSLLVGAVLTLGAAVRVKLYVSRQLREARARQTLHTAASHG